MDLSSFWFAVGVAHGFTDRISSFDSIGTRRFPLYPTFAKQRDKKKPGQTVLWQRNPVTPANKQEAFSTRQQHIHL